MRRSALAAGAAAFVLALAGCGNTVDGRASGGTGGTGGTGGDGGFMNLSELVSSSSDKASEASSSRFSMETTGMGQTMRAEGEARYAGTDTAMSMTMDVQGRSIEMRLVDRTMYMKMPQVQGAEPGTGTDKPWVEMSLDGDNPMAEAMGGGAGMAEQSDPTKVLEQLEQYGGEIVDTRETTLDGEQVTRYTVELDMTKAAAMMGGEQLRAEPQPSQDTTIPMELYLDSQNLPRRIEMNLDVMGRSASMVMNYSDWGTPVTIEAPPADQVTQFESADMPGGN
ncbi:hypothetical protein [Saccharomonospora iraqiensis]|uniref:hypothetical protein n=1 Tax=Saccharomonospora iraqiensis TaxID=52698 RepID=UPI00040B8002|nr:hypothetical protein [Saccharomonospora iraqiensis]